MVILNNICSFLHYIGFGTMKGFVLKNLREHDFNSQQLGPVEATLGWESRGTGKSQGSSSSHGS